MKRFKTGTMILGMGIMSAVFAPSASADERNRKTVVTFSAPVEIPAVHLKGWGVLPAGTYVFKILDSLSDRHIVQIFNQDETTIYATILAIPNYRLKATDKTVMTFRERAAGEPEALRAWFYPGRNWGEEFVYPKEKAMTLAKATNTPVLFTPAALPLEVAEPIKANAPIVMEMRRVPIMAIQPTGVEVRLAEVVTPPPAEAATSMAAAPAAAVASSHSERTLPATAGTMPLIGLLGLMALGGAYAVSAIARRLQ